MSSKTDEMDEMAEYEDYDPPFRPICLPESEGRPTEDTWRVFSTDVQTHHTYRTPVRHHSWLVVTDFSPENTTGSAFDRVFASERSERCNGPECAPGTLTSSLIPGGVPCRLANPRAGRPSSACDGGTGSVVRRRPGAPSVSSAVGAPFTG